MKVLATLAVFCLVSVLVSADILKCNRADGKCPPPEDECSPEFVCEQCYINKFPADLCCQGIKSYYKLRLADASGCGGYYQCVDGKAVKKQCPRGLHFSLETDRCEWPCNANCDSKATCEPGQAL